MKIRVPNYYKEFKCIASACEDTCCAGWDVVIDSQTYELYQNMEGAFGDKLRNKMVVDQDGDTIFVLDGERCPFLNHENLCDIHKEKGEQFLSYTCKQYPRYMADYIELREMGISLSCPEAARIILRSSKITAFELSENRQVGDKTYEDEKDKLEVFLKCRATIIKLLEMEDISLGLRAAMVLRFVEELQDKLDFGELDAINQIRGKYNKSSYIKELVKAFDSNKGNEVQKHKDVYEYFKTYKGLEHINTNDPLGLNKVLKTYWKSQTNIAHYMDKHKAFNQYYKEKMDKFKKILVYYIYRYFMKSFYDYDMSSKIKLAIMSTIMIKELAIVRWIENGDFSESDMVDISHRYSKDIEHLEANVERLEKIFETEDVYAVDKIINTLINAF